MPPSAAGRTIGTSRKFSILGQVFWPQDGAILAFGLLLYLTGIAVFTAATETFNLKKICRYNAAVQLLGSFKAPQLTGLARSLRPRSHGPRHGSLSRRQSLPGQPGHAGAAAHVGVRPSNAHAG